MKKVSVIIVCLLIVLSGIYFGLISKNKSEAFKGQTFSQAYEGCAAKPDQDIGNCLRELADHAYHTYTVAEINTSIDTISIDKLRWCHELMHYIGWEAYDEKDDLSEAFSEASDKCDSGMYHGVAEEYINKMELEYDPETFARTIVPNACEESLFKNKLPGMKWICLHGLGHAFMFITENDLKGALKYCDYLGQDRAQACYTGALMENIDSKQVGRFVTHPRKYGYKEDDPDYPCSILDERYKDHCYKYKGVSGSSKGEYKKAFEDCLMVSSGYREKCFWGVGSNIPAPVFTSYSAGEKCNFALEVSGQAYEQCISGAMSFLVQLNLGDAQDPVEFCDAIKTNYKNTCYREAGKQLRGWLKEGESIESKCELFKDKNAREQCLNGN